MASHSPRIHVGDVGDTGKKRENWRTEKSTTGLRIEHKRASLLSTIETMPDKFPRTPGDGEAEPDVSEITNRRWELAGRGDVE